MWIHVFKAIALSEWAIDDHGTSEHVWNHSTVTLCPISFHSRSPDDFVFLNSRQTSESTTIWHNKRHNFWQSHVSSSIIVDNFTILRESSFLQSIMSSLKTLYADRTSALRLRFKVWGEAFSHSIRAICWAISSEPESASKTNATTSEFVESSQVVESGMFWDF